jgi:hypothetical protein
MSGGILPASKEAMRREADLRERARVEAFDKTLLVLNRHRAATSTLPMTQAKEAPSGVSAADAENAREALGYSEDGEGLPRGSAVGIETVWDEDGGKWRRLATTLSLPGHMPMTITEALQVGLLDRYGRFVWHVHERLKGHSR